MITTIYGTSDDLIQVEGDVDAEFLYRDDPDDPGNLLACSDGTVVRVVLAATGVWRITPVARGSSELTISQAPEDDEDRSDRATLVGEIRWVVQGIAHATATVATR